MEVNPSEDLIGCGRHSVWDWHLGPGETDYSGDMVEATRQTTVEEAV